MVGAQFFGAFNDNLFKQLLLFLAARQLFPGEDMQGLAFAIFALPFVIFSGIAGDLSERLSKRRIILQMKWVEIGVMLLGALAFYSMGWYFMLLVLFLMGTQSAFFGPSKYGVIPELVPPEQLISANGTIAMTTFMAILMGQALAGPLMDRFGEMLWLPALFCVGFAILGTGIAQIMRPMKALRPELPIGLNPFGSLWSTTQDLRRREGLFPVLILHSLFWFNGGVIQQAILAFGEPGILDVGEGENSLLSYLMVTLALFIIIGSLIAPLLSRRLGPGRLATWGGFGMFLGQLGLLSLGLLFGREQGGFWVAHLLLGLIGFSGACFVVPVQSYLQDAPPPGMRGQTFAVNNFMCFLFLFFAGIWYLLARQLLELGPALTQALAGAAMLAYLFYRRRALAEIVIKEDET